MQTVAANWERQEALTQATNIMRAQPDLKGFFVANDDMGLGVARAVANAGKTGKVKVISVDGIKDALSRGQGRRLDAVVAQYPYAIGLMGMEACQAAAQARPCRPTSRRRSRWSPRRTPTQALAATPKPFGTTTTRSPTCSSEGRQGPVQPAQTAPTALAPSARAAVTHEHQPGRRGSPTSASGPSGPPWSAWSCWSSSSRSSTRRS